MCTVTFLPLPGCGGYLLATNRDESPARGEARAPERHGIAGLAVLAPVDIDKGGSWVAVDERGRTLCVLNGDRPPAVAPADDAPSRGLLLMELMARASADAVTGALHARRAAGHLREKPFKLLVAEPGDQAGNPPVVTRLEWDGARLVESRSTAPTLFVSSSFEPDVVEARRRGAFEALARHDARDADALLAVQRDFHTGHAPGAEEGDAYSVCMHRADAASRSLTRVAVTADAVRMGYHPGQPCITPEGAWRELQRRPATAAG